MSQEEEKETAPPSPNKYRLQIDFSEEAYSELIALQNYINSPSKAEVIRDAIGVLRWACDEIHEGNRILVEKKDGQVRKFIFHFIKRPPTGDTSKKSE